MQDRLDKSRNLRFQIGEKDITHYTVTELLSVEVVDLFRSALVNKLDSLILQGLGILENVRKVEV